MSWHCGIMLLSKTTSTRHMRLFELMHQRDVALGQGKLLLRQSVTETDIEQVKMIALRSFAHQADGITRPGRP